MYVNVRLCILNMYRRINMWLNVRNYVCSNIDNLYNGINIYGTCASYMNVYIQTCNYEYMISNIVYIMDWKVKGLYHH